MLPLQFYIFVAVRQIGILNKNTGNQTNLPVSGKLKNAREIPKAGFTSRSDNLCLQFAHLALDAVFTRHDDSLSFLVSGYQDHPEICPKSRIERN